jgi:RNA polymerase sigma factor (TIGR02999 family)
VPKDDIAAVPQTSPEPPGRDGDQAAEAAARNDLLRELRSGRHGAIDQLIPLVYNELRVIAHRQLAARARGSTLSTTALVHETYLKLVDQSRADWRDRAHFLAVASIAMRHVLVDRAKARATLKRGGERRRITLDDAHIAVDDQAEALLQLDEAMNRLAALQPRLARVVECRFFGGLTEDEIAEALGVTVRTVQRDWAKARMLLQRELEA